MADLTIKDVRSKFPQYGDLSDQQLADALHGKFYADMDKTEFYGKIGFAPEPVNSPVVPEVQTQAPAQPVSPSVEPLLGLMSPPIDPASPVSRAAIQPTAPVRVENPIPARAMPNNPTVQMQGPGAGGGMQELYNQGILPRRYVEDPLAASMTSVPAEPDPFAGESFGDLAKRRGQQFARGAAEPIAAIPESLAIANAADAAKKREVTPEYIADLMKQREVLSTTLNDPASKNHPMRAAWEREFTDITAQISEMQGMLGEVENLPEQASQSGTFQKGEQIRQKTAEIFGAPDPRDTSFWAGVAEGAGNMTTMAGTSMAASAIGTPAAGFAAGSGQGAAMNMSQLYKEAIDAGASEQDAQRAAKWGAAIGTTEIVPIGRALKLLPPRLRGEVGSRFFRAFSDIAQSSGEEAAQEYLSQVANNMVASGIYDPERGWNEGAGEAALVGAILGGGMGAAGVAINGTSDQDANQIGGAMPPETPAQRDADPLIRAMGAQAGPISQKAPQPEMPQQDPQDNADGTNTDQAVNVSPDPQKGGSGRFEIMDEVENVDGETVPTGRKVRVNLETGEVSPVESSTSSQSQDVAMQSRPQDAPDVGPDVAPVAGDANLDASEDAGTPEDNAAGDEAISSIRVETLPSEQVARVGTDAKTFQYKDHGDENGVTDRLQGITDWDERSAMGGIIYEYADGRRVVADGHQRLGLAKRLQKNGVKTPWNVELIREKDGFTPADVRRIAALKNIREGSGTAIDAAKVLREAPDEIDSLNLPPKSALVRDAKGLSRLSDDAFGMVVNEVVKPEWGAVVGENVADPAMHADVVSLLKKLNPSNNAQAAMIAQQAGQQQVTETQGSLFGDEEVSQSLYLERAKVLDGAMKRLKRNKQTFQVLSDRAETIAQAGNVLNQEANADRVEADSKAAAYLAAEANRKGPISDALTNAAKELKSNPRSGGRIIADFLAAIRSDETGSVAQESRPDGSSSDPAPERSEEVNASTDTDFFGALDDVFGDQGGDAAPDDQMSLDGFGPNPEKDARARAADQRRELEARSQQSKMRTVTEQDDAGPLFGGGGDLFDAADRGATSATEKLPEAQSNAGKYADVAPEWTQSNDFTDLSSDFEGFDPDNIGVEARDYVLSNGRREGVEFLVIVNETGEIISIGKGTKSNTGVSKGMALVFDPEQSLVVHHNHPRSATFSASDLGYAAMPGMHAIYAHTHDGTSFRASATEAFRALSGIDSTPLTVGNYVDRAMSMSRLIDLLNRADLNYWKQSARSLERLTHAGAFKDAKVTNDSIVTLDAGRYHKAAFSLAMRDAGLIDLTVENDVFGNFDPETNPFLFDPVLKKLYERLVQNLKDKVAGVENGDLNVRRTDDVRHIGDLAGLSSPASKESPEGRISVAPDVSGRDQERQGGDRGKELTPDKDFEGALDDVFGEPQPKKQKSKQIKRTSSEIAKDMQAILRGLKEDSRRDVDSGKYDQLKPLFIEALDGIDLADYDRRGLFATMIRPLAKAGLTRDDVTALYPYFTRFLDDADRGIIDLEGASDASSARGDLEQDRGNTDTRDGMGGADVSPAAGGNGQSSGDGRGAPDGYRGERQSRRRISDGDAASMGTRGDQPVQDGERAAAQPSIDRERAGSGDLSKQGLPADPGTAEDTSRHASDSPDVIARKAKQAEADKVRVRFADRDNIDKSLPLLLPEQRDDVWKVETRFSKTDKDGKPIGHGMLLTNGTGTGKTYSGGGVIKRFSQQGKDNILILAPSQGILDAWVDMGVDLGLDIKKLEDTTSAGTGIVATTYANAGENNQLATRDWDLVVSDESQKLSQNATGDQTSALRTVRAITNRPENLRDRAMMLRADDWDRMQQMPDNSQEKGKLARELHDDLKVQVEELSKKPRSKVLFLSATPFAYDKNVDYAEGYLFDYGKDGVTESGSRQSGQNLFMVENFGYRIRYHKLTKPEAAVDSGVFERQFHERLKREGVLSGRSLDVDADYDRKFVQIESAEGEKIDAALKLIRDKSDNTADGRKWRELGEHVRRNFTYLRRMQLLEAIKARQAIPDIKKHLALGRKIVVFHDYNKGGGFNPFRGSDVVAPTAQAMEGYKLLLAEMPEVADLNFAGLGSPLETLTKEFGARAVTYNGTVSKKERDLAKKSFNQDGSGKDIIIVQSAAGEAGISLHDTSGSHQRVLINLGMPVRPTTTLQEEGRIRRVGSVSDAIFRYYTTGTAWERQAFAGKIAENSGTVENLALGDEARAIRDSFVNAYMEAEFFEPRAGEGKGGRELDRSVARVTPYDQAKTHYFARTKNNQRRDRRAGLDFYSTPEPLGFKMAEWAGARTYERALEPSAGDGAIARYLPADADRTIIEPSTDLITKAQLRTPGAKAVQERFEDHHIVNKYDVVVMNPPFGSGGKTAMDHLRKAMKHVKPGGRVVALIPTGPAADKQFQKMFQAEDFNTLEWNFTADVSLPAVTFEKAGTSVASHVVIFDRVMSPDQMTETKHINMTGARSIAEFFDRLEHISVPARPEISVEADAEILEVSPAPVGADAGFDTFEFANTKTGADVYGVQITEQLGDRFKEVAGIARANGGYYSRYQNRDAGARRGFLFKSDEDRAAFIEDVQKPRFGLEETSPEFQADPRANPAFLRWFGDSKVVDERGAPLVLWHGTAMRKYTPEWDAFKGMTWGARDAGLAIDYANARAAMSKGGEYYARLHELFMRIERPFNADLGVPRTVQIDDITNAMIEQAEDQGRTLGDTKGQRMAELIETLQAARVREESGPSYSRHDFWNDTASLFGRDGADAVAEMFDLLGFDGVTMIENGVETWGAFRPDQVKGRYNRGTFDPETDKFMERRGQSTADTIAPAMPALRAELDRMNLKRVKLSQDTTGQRLGAFSADKDGAMEILIGPSLDHEATLYHESIHAMRTLNLFTPQEWRALEIKAAKTWVDQYDIAGRYPDLFPSEQIEEAIAEAFSDAAKTRNAPKGSILVQAFNKIARLLKAFGNALRGAGFQTVEDVFGRAMAGDIGARDAANTGFASKVEKEARFPRRQTAQQRAHAATAMNANGGFAFIPDRRIWEELSAANASYWQRLKGGAAAANDWVDKARIKMQDRFLPVLRAQEAIMSGQGRALPESHNAYLAEETFSGKVGRHLFEIDEDYTKPIIDIMAGGKGEAMLDTEYVGTWLYARHAQERNARIASINPRMQDGGSGMTNADAAQILADAANGPDAARLQKIGDLIDKLRDRTLKLREDAGLITAAEADLWRNQYQFYVPLKGFADTDHSEAMLDFAGVGRRFNTRGAETKRALGRQSEAFNPLQAAITQAQEVSIRAEKNRVGQKLFKLAKDFPSPELWSVKTPKQKRFYNRTTGLVETRVEDPVSLFMEPNEMAVKVAGKEHRVIFHDIRLARAAGSVGADQMGSIVKAASMFSRYFSSINTMLNPVFTVTNAFRDMITAQISIGHFGGKDANKIRIAMIKNWPKAFIGAYRGMGNNADSEWTRYYREFEESGAKVSFWNLEQPEAEILNLKKRIHDQAGNLPRRSLKYLAFSTQRNPVLWFIDRTNLAVDNAIRLAAYVEARKRGWSKADAASLSKNLTVNFNRRGEMGATINAFWTFANAAIQGTHTLARSMKSKQVRRIVIGIMLMSLLQDLVNASLSKEDDDGELAYDKIPGWKTQMNSVFMLGGPASANGAATVPLPYGYNIFFFAGQQFGKVSRGVKTPEQAFADMMDTTFSAFSPLGSGSFQQFISPTMLDPINEMAMNEDWLGRPIRPENPFADYGPDAYKYFGGVSDISKEIADAANRATGGTIAEPGLIDFSPEYLDYMFGFMTGGAGRTAGQFGDLAAKAIRGEWDNIEENDIPFANRVHYQTGDWLDRDRYYRFRTEVMEARDAMKTYQDTGMQVPEHIRQMAGLYDANREAEKALREMRAAKRAIEARNDLTASEISERVAAIDERAAKVYLGFNKMFIRVNGPQGE